MKKSKNLRNTVEVYRLSSREWVIGILLARATADRRNIKIIVHHILSVFHSIVKKKLWESMSFTVKKFETLFSEIFIVLVSFIFSSTCPIIWIEYPLKRLKLYQLNQNIILYLLYIEYSSCFDISLKQAAVICLYY